MNDQWEGGYEWISTVNTPSSDPLIYLLTTLVSSLSEHFCERSLRGRDMSNQALLILSCPSAHYLRVNPRRKAIERERALKPHPPLTRMFIYFRLCDQEEQTFRSPVHTILSVVVALQTLGLRFPNITPVNGLIFLLTQLFLFTDIPLEIHPLSVVYHLSQSVTV